MEGNERVRGENERLREEVRDCKGKIQGLEG